MATFHISFNKAVIFQDKMSLQDIFAMLYTFILYLYIKKLMTLFLVCATINSGHKKSRGTEPRSNSKL